MAFALATAASLKAFAADPGVVATAPAGTGAPVLGAPPANDATGSQIADWVATDGALSQPRSDTPPPRTIHGEVGAGVGTGGYRSVYGVADIPVGQTGDLIVAGSSSSGQVRGGRYGGERDALALGFSSNGAPGSASGCGRPLWGQAGPSPTPIGCSSPPQP
jgi:hypothetical protein